jgi:AraC family transcriptional regulator, L-rhamnose operon transcriptional activator RhaR
MTRSAQPAATSSVGLADRRGLIRRGAVGQVPGAPSRLSLAPPMRRETGSRYFDGDSAVAIFVAHHYPTIAWHEHDFYELAVVATGRGLHESEHGIIPVEAGSVVFIPPGVSHEYRGCEDLVVYNCLFQADLDEAELMWAFRDGHLGRLFNPDGLSRAGSRRPPVAVRLDDQGLANVLAALEPIRENSPDARSRTGQLAHLLLALDVVATASQDLLKVHGERPLPAAVAAAMALMERDITFPWTLSELSAETFVSRTHLARTFAKCLGLPPIHYLSRLRAERAAVMLARTDDAVASIGAAVGWPDPAYFSRRFRGVFGVSPREYRNRHQRGSAGEATPPVALRA